MKAVAPGDVPQPLLCRGALVLALLVVLAPSPVHAQAAPPAAHEEEAFDFMNLLTHYGLHNIRTETWNLYGQFTYIAQGKPPFPAPYTNANGSIKSLLPDAEYAFTGSFTLFFGLKLWRGGEAYLVPEVIAEQPFSNLSGLGGSIQNFELQKTGSISPQIYRSRLFLRQTVDLGGKDVVVDSNPMVLGTVVQSRRLVFTLGNFSILDVFDRNNVTWDPRQTFFNIAFMTHSSWDFPADARGYSWGLTGELYWDDWAVRVGWITPPLEPNTLPIDFRIWEYFGTALELEHDHTLFGQPGAVRLLGYLNRVFTGSFGDAIRVFEGDPEKNAASCTSFNYGSGNFTAPDLCWVRKPNIKMGLGIDFEQYFMKDIGMFLRAMYSDGQSEVDAFNSADRDLSIGATAKGSAWGRPFDVTGIGVGLSFISAIHAQYMQMGGIDAFVGDGALTPGVEGVTEVFYSANLLNAIWLAGDYQFIWNPGFNEVRGPVHVFGAKVHAEF